MNALELAEYMENTERWNVAGVQMQDCADMLRRQHEAIVKLREALVFASTYVQEDEAERGRPYLTGQVIRNALKDTEDFQCSST